MGRYLLRYADGDTDWVNLESEKLDWGGGGQAGDLERSNWVLRRRRHCQLPVVQGNQVILQRRTGNLHAAGCAPSPARCCERRRPRRGPVPAGLIVGPTAGPRPDVPETVNIVCNNLRGTFHVKRSYVILPDGSEMTPTGGVRWGGRAGPLPGSTSRCSTVTPAALHRRKQAPLRQLRVVYRQLRRS